MAGLRAIYAPDGKGGLNPARSGIGESRYLKPRRMAAGGGGLRLDAQTTICASAASCWARASSTECGFSAARRSN